MKQIKYILIFSSGGYIKNVVYIPALLTTLPEIAGTIQASAASGTSVLLTNVWTEL